MLLHELPREILCNVAEASAQSDTFRMALTCRSLRDVMLPRLYQCIVIDSTHRDLCAHLERRNTRKRGLKIRGDTSVFLCTTVHTVAGVRGCLRSLRDPDKAALVQRLEFCNSLEIPDLEVKASFKSILHNLTSLRCLVWNSSPEISLDMLCMLTKPTNLTTLSLDAAIRHDAATRQFGTLRLAALRHFELRPFISTKILKLVAKTLKNSECARSLELLALGREMTDSHEVGSGFAFASLTGENQVHLRSFLSELGDTQLNLQSLVLEGFEACQADVDLLAHTVNLSGLLYLTLQGSDEDCFLVSVAPKLSSLQHASIDWSDGITNFVSNVPCGLRSLKARVRWIPSRQANSTSWVEHCLCLFESIVRVRSDSLKGLFLEGLEVQSHRVMEKSMPLKALHTLTSLYQLEGLSLASGEIQALVSSFASSTNTFPRLSYLEARQPRLLPCLSLESIQCTDDMTRMSQLARQISEAYRSLEYMKLESVVFHVKGPGKLELAVGMDAWLASQISPTWVL